MLEVECVGRRCAGREAGQDEDSWARDGDISLSNISFS